MTGPRVGSQHRARLRFEWGPTGAQAIVPDAEVMVVVDVLSFTTTLSVAVDRGVSVLPYGVDGAVIGSLLGSDRFGSAEVSPEAVFAAHAWSGVSAAVEDSLMSSSSGAELVETGFEADVRIAAEVDASDRVPVVHGNAFVGEG